MIFSATWRKVSATESLESKASYVSAYGPLPSTALGMRKAVGGNRPYQNSAWVKSKYL